MHRSAAWSRALALALVTVACRRGADTPPVVDLPDSVALPPTTVTAPATIAPSASVASTGDSWVARSDSALATMLPGLMFGADSAAIRRAHYCEMDGSDSPPILIAAVRARRLGYDSASYHASEQSSATRDILWRVEVTSVALLTPAADAGVPLTPSDTMAAQRVSYSAAVGVRVDTLVIATMKAADEDGVLQVCPYGEVRGAITPYWMFATDNSPWIDVVRWVPATASWARVTSLADSVRKQAR